MVLNQMLYKYLITENKIFVWSFTSASVVTPYAHHSVLIASSLVIIILITRKVFFSLCHWALLTKHLNWLLWCLSLQKGHKPLCSSIELCGVKYHASLSEDAATYSVLCQTQRSIYERWYVAWDVIERCRCWESVECYHSELSYEGKKAQS